MSFLEGRFPNRPTRLYPFQSQKGPPRLGWPILIGGGGGDRTRVQKTVYERIYMLSRL